MQPNTVNIDRSGTAPVFTFADSFNVSTCMIDRHLDEGRGERLAYVTDGGQVTYAELAARVNCWGQALRDAGMAPGDRLMMVVRDCPEFVYLFYGAIRTGIIPVPLNTLLRTADYRYMFEDSGCSAVIYSQDFAGEVEPALAEASPKPAFTARLEGPGGMAEWVPAGPVSIETHPSTASADCFWLYSSGSTGRPKGTVHRQRDLLVNTVLYTEPVMDITEDDILFSAAKLFFAYGLGNSMSFPLFYGACTILSDERPTPEMTFRIIKKFRPTIFFGVPTLYAAQCRALETETPDLSSLRACISAGEALPSPIFRRWKEKTGLTLIDGIGSTECTHIFISNLPGDARPGTSGKALPGYEARIVDEDGNDVAQGDVGRLWVRGQSVAARYWNQPKRTAATMLGNDWLNTGDTYQQDEDGYFVYCGRSDDMIKVGGIWCSPIEIESRLIDHPLVLEAGVVGREDDDGLVKPEAHIVLKDPNSLPPGLKDDLLEHCKAGLARYKYPRWFHFVEDLPKTATGKIQRFRLRTGE